MLSGCQRFKNSVSREIRSIARVKGQLILFMILGAVLIIAGWMFFEGPCRLSLFFKIPGGGFTVTLYYILWFIMFLIGGAECAVYLNFFRNSEKICFLYHFAAYMCMLLWYPLFFTLFSQFLALIVITAALVLHILNIKTLIKRSCLLSLISVIRIVILGIYLYINLAFLIIN